MFVYDFSVFTVIVCILADTCISVNDVFYVNDCSCVQWFCGRCAFPYRLNHKMKIKYSISFYRRFNSATLQVIGCHTDLGHLMVSILASVCKRSLVQSKPSPLVLKIKQDYKGAIRKVGAFNFCAFFAPWHSQSSLVILGTFDEYVNNINLNIT
jgi:hypothetical protein